MLGHLEAGGYIRRASHRARSVEVLRGPGVPRPWTADEGLAYASAWRIRMKPHFDALYGPERSEGFSA
jgi:hypothetical protein